MLTPKFIKENLELVKRSCRRRYFAFDERTFQAMEKKRTALIQSTEKKKAHRNQVSKAIGLKKYKGEEVSEKEIMEMKVLSEEIAANDQKLEGVLSQMESFCLGIPNLITDRVPDGKDEADNKLLKTEGEPRQFDFPVKDHTTLLEENNWSDFPRAAKISGARFAILRGEAAALERSLAQFFLSENLKVGYEEYRTPVIVRKDSLRHTGQLPKFKEDIFPLHNDEGIPHFYLIPTAEVPLTNLYADEIIPEESLPLRFTAHTSCFRSEAGSAGKDTRGLIRLHEFSKVELVEITRPEESEAAHERIITQAEHLLKALELPYRLVRLSAGDIGFSAQDCVDIEVWLPGQNTYREISSCSNCGNFQAVRGKIRYRNSEGTVKSVHTLNGSSLPIGRALVAILENHQQKDGSVTIPTSLVTYLGKKRIGGTG